MIVRKEDEAETRRIVSGTVWNTGKGGDVENAGTMTRIMNQLEKIVTGACRRAFIANGFGDPRQKMLDSLANKAKSGPGYFMYTIVSAFALNNDGVSNKLGLSADSRQALLNRGTAASTDIGSGVTVIRSDILMDNHSLEWIITHEFFHGIGIPGKYYSQSFPGSVVAGPLLGPSIEQAARFHDLSYLGAKYDKVMADCAPAK